MKDRRDCPHADCPVRYRARGQTLCGATDTPCVYCADRADRPADLSRARRRKQRDARNNRPDRNTPPFEDS